MKKIYLSISKQSNVSLIEKLKEELSAIGADFYQYEPGPERYNEDEVLENASAIIVVPPNKSFNVESDKAPVSIIVGKGNFGEASWGLSHALKVYAINEYDYRLHEVHGADILDAKSWTRTGELVISGSISIHQLIEK